jgi:hypothetical protein
VTNETIDTGNRYVIRPNQDGSYAVARGSREVMTVATHADAKWYRDGLNQALDMAEFAPEAAP